MKGITVSDETNKLELTRVALGGIVTLLAALGIGSSVLTGTVVGGVKGATEAEFKGYVQEVIAEDKRIDALMTPEELEAHDRERDAARILNETVATYGTDIAGLKTGQTDIQNTQTQIVTRLDDIAAKVGATQ